MDLPSTSEFAPPSIDDIRTNVMSNTPGWISLMLAIIGIILGALALILYSTVSAPPTMSYRLVSMNINRNDSVSPEMNTLYELTSNSNANLKIKQLTKGYTQGIVSYYKNMTTAHDITITPESSGTSSSVTLKPGKGAMFATGKNGYSTSVVYNV